MRYIVKRYPAKGFKHMFSLAQLSCLFNCTYDAQYLYNRTQFYVCVWVCYSDQVLQIHVIPSLLEDIWCYKLAEWYNNVLRSQYSHNIAIAVYSWIPKEICLSLLVFICSLSRCWMSPVARKHCMGWSKLRPVAVFKGHFAPWSALILYVGLSHIHSSYILVWLAQGDIHTLLISSGKNIYTTSWSTRLIQLFIWNKDHHLVLFMLW